MVTQLNHETYEYNNKTLYGIQSSAVRYSWAGYFTIVFLSLAGDLIVLIASLRYRVFRIHKVIVAIIEHIAVCDSLVSLCVVVPIIPALIAGKQVLGDTLCNISCYLNHILNSAAALLICNMVLSKLIILKYPLRLGSITMKRAHISCAVCWLLASSFALVFLTVDGRDVYFSYRSYTCAYGFSAKVWIWLHPIIVIIFIVIPTCLVVASTINLMLIAKQVARRGRDSLKWQGIITTVVTATVYCISIIPFAVYRFGEAMIDTDNKSQSFFHTVYFRLAFSLPHLNAISNIYIYGFTVTGFRLFLKNRIQSVRRF